MDGQQTTQTTPTTPTNTAATAAPPAQPNAAQSPPQGELAPQAPQSAEPQGGVQQQQQPPEPMQGAAQEPTTQDPQPPEGGTEAGVVPKPSEYTLPEGAPDNLRIFAHEQGLTQGQLDATLSQFGGYVQNMHQTEQAALKQMGEAHLKNWGPEAKQNLTLAKAALSQNDPDGALLNALEQSGYGNHPAVLNFLYNVGKSMQEGGFLKSAIPRKPGDKTVAQSMYGGNHPSKEN